MRDSNIATKKMLAKIEDAYFRIRMLFRHGRKMFFAQEHFFVQTERNPSKSRLNAYAYHCVCVNFKPCSLTTLASSHRALTFEVTFQNKHST